ncbi:MAG TPA: hypothetical protein VMM18_09740 [Gemmatimonadaceae bacterium]|nr:hypothetical protein [Gemmatimonadaceae bacterium]
MNIAREEILFIGIALLATTGAFALALHRRSWSLWLTAFAMTVLTLVLAWALRS